MKIKKYINLSLFLIVNTTFISLYGCTQTPVYVNPSKMNLNQKFFKKKSQEIENEIKKNPSILDKDKNLKSLDWYENSASICYFAKNYNLSYNLFDYADTKINLYEQKLLSQKLGENLASIFVNDLIKDYTPPIYERVFVNVYMSHIDLLKNNFNNFNINLNRAIERLKYAHTIFEKEISLYKEKETKKQKFKIKKESLSPIEKEYSSLDLYKPYQDFENPYVYYLKGIYYLYDGERLNSMDMFKTVYGLIKDREPATDIISKAWELAKSNEKRGYLWVIYLNGLSFKKVEKKFEIPIYTHNGVILISVALPTLKERKKGSDTLYIVVENTTSKKVYSTKRFVNVDNLVAFEFRQRMKYIVPKEILRAAVKALIQAESKKHFGFFGNLVSTIYTKTTSKADTRQWIWLPKEIQINIIKIPKKGKITIYVPNHRKYTLNFNETNSDQSKIIFVRSFYPKDEVIYYEANLP